MLQEKLFQGTRENVHEQVGKMALQPFLSPDSQADVASWGLKVATNERSVVGDTEGSVLFKEGSAWVVMVTKPLEYLKWWARDFKRGSWRKGDAKLRLR